MAAVSGMLIHLPWDGPVMIEVDLSNEVTVDKQCQFLYLISYINRYLPVELEYFCSTSC